MVQFMGIFVQSKHGELLSHALRKAFQFRQAEQRQTFVGGHRYSQNPGRAWIGRLNHALCIEHHDACRQIVQDGLQITACCIQLNQAALHVRTGIRQLLRHVCK